MKESQPRVSLLVPVYGVEAYIERCARSLFAQTYTPIEYIFVDDCSPDRSIELLERVLDDYPHRRPQVRIIRHDRNRGVAVARNTGIALLTGEWVLMQDSDDWLEEDAIERLVAATNEDVDMVSFDYYKGPAPCNTTVLAQRQRPADGGEWLRAALRRDSDVAWMLANKLLRCSMLMHNEIRCVEGANMAEDMNLMIKLSCHIRQIVHLPVPLFHYLAHPGSICADCLSRKHEIGFCTNITDAVAYVRRQGLYERFEADFIHLALWRKYEMLWRSQLDNADCVRDLLPEANSRIFRADNGLSLRRKLVVWLGVHGWEVPLRWMLGLSAEWRRLQRAKK